MIPYLIAGAIGFVVAKIFDEDEAPKYEDGGSVLLAPNGKPSKLTPEQYKLVRRPEFKAWFGDWENSPETSSKVIDEETKEPLVVYHGSNIDFNVFEKSKTNPYAEKQGYFFSISKKYAESYNSKYVKPFFINIRIKGTFDDDDNLVPFNADGNIVQGLQVEVYDKNNIKLADGSNTTFDGNNPDIRFEEGGEIKVKKIKGELRYYNKGAYANVNIIDKDEWHLSMIENQSGEKGGASKILLQIIKDARANNVKKISLFASYENKQIFHYNYGFKTISYGEYSGLYNMELDLSWKYAGKQFKADWDDDVYIHEEFDLGGTTMRKTKLLAPNGKPSKLTPEQYKLVRLPEFKAWFGDWENDPANSSKVIDEETKEPLVLYHGTKNDFNVFDIEKSRFDYLYFAVNKEYAEKFGKVKSYFINANKIKDVTRVGIKNITTDNAYRVLGWKIEPAYTYNKQKFWIHLKESDEIYRTFKYNNYGAIKFIEDYTDDGSYIETEAFAIINPSIIKLADGSNDTFDSNNPDIRFELGGIFHGSPYNFDRFTTSKMSSGIGQQDDGWGLYLTTDKDGAKKYGQYIYETTLFKGKKENEYNFLELKKPVPKDLVKKIVEAVYKYYNKEFDINKFNSYYDYVKNQSLPKVDFNDFELLRFDYDGYLFYKTLSRTLGGDKKASLFLLDNRIDGLKSSFVNNKGVHYRTDYVIFDENAITIENIEHLPNNYYADGGSVLLAPNGKPSKLTPEQYKLVRLPEFKAWFGDWEKDPANASKVIDENGEPLPVYHGTLNGGFTVFNMGKISSQEWDNIYGSSYRSGADPTSFLGSHFAKEKDVAEKFLNGIYSHNGDNPKIYECFLNLRNVQVIDENDLQKKNNRTKCI